MCLRRFASFYLTVAGLTDRHIEASFVHLIELTSADNSIDKSADYIRTPSNRHCLKPLAGNNRTVYSQALGVVYETEHIILEIKIDGLPDQLPACRTSVATLSPRGQTTFTESVTTLRYLLYPSSETYRT